MTTSTVSDTLNTLLRGELSATETYEQAVQMVRPAPVRKELERICEEHREAVIALRNHIRYFGGEPDDTSGLWGVFALGVEGTATLLGDAAALQVLQEGEEYGASLYQEVMADEELPHECRAYVRTQLLPRTLDHIRSLQRALANCSD